MRRSNVGAALGVLAVGVMFVGVMFVGVMASGIAIHYSTQENVRNVRIEDKERVVTSGSAGKTDSKYLIFTDKEVFENTDSLLAFKFNSSDLYGKIHKGQTCEFKVVGFRVPFLSMYRNILEAKCQ